MTDMLAVFSAAAEGKFPPQDGQVEVRDELPGPATAATTANPAAAIVAFPAHFYVLAPVSAEWVHERLPPGDFSAPLGARFIVELADRIGAHIGSSDAVLAAWAHGRSGENDLELARTDDADHPRVRRARYYRDDVRVWQTRDGAGCVALGRGLAGRWEVSFEVDPEARGRGLGRALAGAALGFLPAGTPVFAQVAPGNTASLRAVLAAGYSPVGGEVLLPFRPGLE